MRPHRPVWGSTTAIKKMGGDLEELFFIKNLLIAHPPHCLCQTSKSNACVQSLQSELTLVNGLLPSPKVLRPDDWLKSWEGVEITRLPHT